ncbi:glycoside hydrolase family 43 protein [Clostridium felsineum]|uniref:Non-reducing end alpha-L-arabinofuranosidase BoGH43A n=1 Tax=Clostridium felsineum TaxID=36839 RepID=A0A1S8KZK7_9CLOT|nr:glycoside hydrolase family 43 protein [Clostridium felsineum]URZ07607.1 Non-reducing end alpha-L-arabinofuranosidase BoGH43A [Clostridium felsineum]URZ12638.1 Non-reducing end alpha-L-arabinofuranosidase BoGH43A [Clostridium felsineum]
MFTDVLDNKNFKNPILPGFYPDPSICRVGEIYYMVNSSFAFFPGIPIFQSADLVNWEQIGHVLDRESQLKLDGAYYSGGIFAPTIRYHEGVFYVITTNVDNRGNFIVTANDPKGPWSEPYFIENAPGIDPSLFFDEDGKVYYTGCRETKNPRFFGDSEIWLQEIDLDKMQLKGESSTIWRGALKDVKCPEGPHIYKINGMYYLVISEGGTEHYHAITVARSKNISGPYEGNPGNPILTHRHLGKDYPISNTGHADLVKTQNDDWYMVLLGSRPYGGYYKNLGRETFLVPVVWEDGWPIVSPGTGKVEFEYPFPNLPRSDKGQEEIRDDFDKEVLDYKWNSLRTPKEKFWSLKERSGFLRLKLKPMRILDVVETKGDNNYKKYAEESPSFLARRQQHINFEVLTKMEFTPENDKETAGIALIQNNNHQFRLEYSMENGHKVVRLVSCKRECKESYVIDYEGKNIESTINSKVFEADVLYLKVTAIGQEYNFYYGSSLDEMKLLAENVDGRILSWELAGGFIGTCIGLFASSNGEASCNHADFDWFDYEGK